MHRAKAALVLAAAGTMAVALSPSRVLAGQQGPQDQGAQVVQPAVYINYRERPRVPFDSQRLKLRPVVDGEIGENEWMPLYTVNNGPVTGTVYMNWDDAAIYIAAKTNQPAWVVTNLDGNGDGWLRGADNIELVTAPVAAVNTTPLTVRLLDALTNRDVPAWNERAVDPSDIQLAVKQEGLGQVVEMAIPRGVAGINPRPGALMGVRVDFLPAGTVPAATAPYEPHLLLEVTLVEARTGAAGGVIGRLRLDDSVLVPGQMLRASFDLVNQLDTPRSIRSVSWSGVGPSEDYLKTLREVALPELKGMKSVRLRYSTPLPETTIPGSYQMSATAVLDDGTTVASTASFTVEEAFSLQVTAEPSEVTVLGPTPIRIIALVASPAPGFKKADVVLTMPASWELKGKPRRSLNIHRENGTGRVVYAVTIPSVTQSGEYRVTCELTWRGKTWTSHAVVKVNRREPTP